MLFICLILFIYLPVSRRQLINAFYTLMEDNGKDKPL